MMISQILKQKVSGLWVGNAPFQDSFILRSKTFLLILLYFLTITCFKLTAGSSEVVPPTTEEWGADEWNPVEQVLH